MDTVRHHLIGAKVHGKAIMIIDDLNNLLFSIKTDESKKQALEVYGNKEVIKSGTRENITTIQIRNKKRI